MRGRRGTGRLRESGWRASATRGDPGSGDWPADRSAAGQPGRPRRIGGRHGRRDGTQLAGSEVSRRFDLVGFDPRGVGHSTPGVRCQHRRRVRRLPARADGRLQPGRVSRTSSRFIGRSPSAASARNGSAFLENVGTASAARDMDAVRQALGDDQINYLGYSYGTELGTAYVERFGDHVRAMVLDGAIDPSVGPIDELINQEAGFQTAFNDYAADCARSTDCPLGTDPNQWVARYHQLIDPLVTKPAPDLGRAQPRLRRRDHRHHQRALHAAALEIPHQRPAGSAARYRSRRPAGVGRRILRT